MSDLPDAPTCLFFASFPPPNTGQTLLTKRFYSFSDPYTRSESINISDPRRHSRASGAFGFRRAVRVVSDLWALRRRVRTDPPDVLYIAAAATRLGHLRDRAATAIARPHVKRIVAHVHNGSWLDLFEGPSADSARALAGAIDLLIMPTETYAERARAYFPADRVGVVPNTFDDELMVSEAELAQKVEARRGRDRMQIVYISNMIPSKGYEALGEALALLHARGVPFEADFAGGWASDDARRAFEARLAEAGVRDRVRIHGSVTDRRKIRELQLGADAFVLPTSYPHEFQPLSIVEALNAGTPVVSTPHATIPDMLTDGGGGVLTEPAPGPIADALERLADVDVWTTFSRNARADFDAQFRTDRVRRQFVEALLGRAHAGAVAA